MTNCRKKYEYMAKMWYDMLSGDVFEDDIEKVWSMLQKDGLVDDNQEWIYQED